MFLQTIDNNLINTKYILCVTNTSNYILCKTIAKDYYKIDYSENIDYLMKEKLSRLLSVKKLTTDIYTQEQLINDMK